MPLAGAADDPDLTPPFPGITDKDAPTQWKLPFEDKNDPDWTTNTVRQEYGDPLFWGVVTTVFSILPVVGSGLVWVPAAISLAIDGNTAGAIGLAVAGLLAGQVHTLIGPMVTRRYAQVHPMITLVGAIAGVSYFGLLGLLLGPLALSYFFELIRMYREEYLTA